MCYQHNMISINVSPAKGTNKWIPWCSPLESMLVVLRQKNNYPTEVIHSTYVSCQDIIWSPRASGVVKIANNSLLGIVNSVKPKPSLTHSQIISK